MNKVSQRAIGILLREAAGAPPHAPAENASEPATPGKSQPVRMTRQLAEALVQASELIEPVAEAAQEWLDAKDEEDRELVAEARERIDGVLAAAPELASLLGRVARLLPASTSAA